MFPPLTLKKKKHQQITGCFAFRFLHPSPIKQNKDKTNYLCLQYLTDFTMRHLICGLISYCLVTVSGRSVTIIHHQQVWYGTCKGSVWSTLFPYRYPKNWPLTDMTYCPSSHRAPRKVGSKHVTFSRLAKDILYLIFKETLSFPFLQFGSMVITRDDHLLSSRKITFVWLRFFPNWKVFL